MEKRAEKEHRVSIGIDLAPSAKRHGTEVFFVHAAVGPRYIEYENAATRSQIARHLKDKCSCTAALRCENCNELDKLFVKHLHPNVPTRREREKRRIPMIISRPIR